MAERCDEMEFSMYGKEGDKQVEGVANFKYLGRSLDQTDNDWLMVRKNHAHKVGLGMVGDATNTGRGGPQGSGNVLQGGNKCGTTLWG